MNDFYDLKTIELDSLMEEGLWHCEKKPKLIKESRNEKVYEFEDGTIMVKKHIGGDEE